MDKTKIALIFLLLIFQTTSATLDNFNYTQTYTMISGGQYPWNNMPATTTEYGDVNAPMRFIAETNEATNYRISGNIITAGAVNARLYLQYSDDNITWQDINNLQYLKLNSQGFQTTEQYTLPEIAKGRKYFRIVGIDGNAAADPNMNSLTISFQVTPNTSGDLNTIMPITIAGKAGTVSYTNMPLVTTELENVTNARFMANTENATQYEFIINRGPLPSATNARIWIQYSDNNSTWVDMNSTTTGVIKINDENSILTTNWVNIPAGAKGITRFFRVVVAGGDGAADPSFYTMLIKFRIYLAGQATATISEPHQIIAARSNTYAYTNMPLATTEIFNAINTQDGLSKIITDTTDMNCYKITTNTSVIGVIGSIMYPQYSDNNVTWTDANTSTVTAPTIHPTGIKQTTCIPLSATARGTNKYFRIVTAKGDEAADPAWRGISLIFEKTITTSAPAAPSISQVIMIQTE